MTSNSVVSLGCCNGGFRWVSIQEVRQMSIKRCPLSSNRWHSLGVCPSGLYILCGSRKESTSGLFGFLWSVPTGIWDVRTVLSFDHWCRICFVVDCSKRKSRSSFVSDLVYCFPWPDSDLIAPAEAGRCVSIFRSLGLHSCPIWGNLGTFQSWTSSMHRPFGQTFILSWCSQQWLVSVKSGAGIKLCSCELIFITCRMFRPWLPSAVTTQRAAIIIQRLEWRDQYLLARAGGATLWRPVLSCMVAWLPHHCTPAHPPPGPPLTELMVSGVDDDTIFPVCRKKEIAWLWL